MFYKCYETPDYEEIRVAEVKNIIACHGEDILFSLFSRFPDEIGSLDTRTFFKIISEAVSHIKKNNSKSFDLTFSDKGYRNIKFYSNDKKEYSYVLEISSSVDKERFQMDLCGFLTYEKLKKDIVVSKDIYYKNPKKNVWEKIVQEYISMDKYGRSPLSNTNHQDMYIELTKNVIPEENLLDYAFSENAYGYEINMNDMESFRERLITFSDDGYLFNEYSHKSSDSRISIRGDDFRRNFSCFSFIVNSKAQKAELTFRKALKEIDKTISYEEFKSINPGFDFTELKRQIKVAAEHGVDISAIPIELQPQQAQGLPTIQSSNNTVETPGTHGEGGSEPDF